MAYQGRKVFTSGEVLTSSDMNSTVDQTVMVFADASARDTAIPTAVEGMIVYLEDTNEVLKYDSAAWVAIIETADDVITTEGDLLVGGVNGVAERVAIGVADTVLTSDGTTISWVVPDSGVVSNNFVVDMNDTTNNSVTLAETKPLGPYTISLNSGDTTFDIYLLDANGVNVGYSNQASITATDNFISLSILGVANDEIISFSFSGSINNTTSEGDEAGAGAYLESITPTDLPSIDDTATVVGGNFGADTEITFESGATVLPAKSITVNTSTELLVTRPDGLIGELEPYTVRAVTTGVPQPTGTNANLLVDAVTAGSDPTWVTTSPLNMAPPDVQFSQTLEATDAEGTITDYSVTAGTLTTGLTLNASTGVLSGTATQEGTFTFTITATDDGGNSTDKEFVQDVAIAIGGTITTAGGYQYHTFTSSDDFANSLTIPTLEYVIIGGGGGGRNQFSSPSGGGGGGAGGLLTASLSNYQPQSGVVTIGAGGGTSGNNGANTSVSTIVTATGGGYGGQSSEAGANGGSGGGGGSPGGGTTSGGTGISGQGRNGGLGSREGNGGFGGGGGGKNSAGSNSGSGAGGNGGAGISLSDYASATSTGDNGFYAGGGGGGTYNSPGGSGGSGGGGRGGAGSNGTPATTGDANTGGGGGGFGGGNSQVASKNGGSGLVILRFEI